MAGVLMKWRPGRREDVPRNWDYVDVTGTLAEREASIKERDRRFSLAFSRLARGDMRPVTYED